jgi:putative oxidoreductase
MYRAVASSGSKAAGPVQSLVRIVVGFLFACHGAASLFGVLGGAVGTHGGTVPAGAWPGWWAAVIQLIGGLLVALGLFTRSAALICSGSMAYAYFTVHQPTGLLPIENNGEPSALYAWIFLLLAVFGPGPWALERFLPIAGREVRPAARPQQATANA